MLSRTENLSIRIKIVIMLCGTALLTLFFVVTALTLYEKRSVKKNLTTELASIANVVGLNNSAALLFNDDRAARENLSLLSTKPSIVAAILYDSSGQIWAMYRQEGHEIDEMGIAASDWKETLDASPSLPESASTSQQVVSFQTNGYLHVIRKVHAQNMLIGYIHLVDDMQTLQDRLISYYQMLGSIVPITFLLVLFMASKLQMLFTAPLFKLMNAMERVTSENNFDVKMPKGGRDEFGILMNHFNQMLHEIQSRDRAVKRYSADLEKRVALRTMDLSQAKKELEETITDLEAAKNVAESANQAKSRFLANMSHEIRTPMNSILGFLSLSLEDETLPSRHREHLTIAHQAANSLLGLLNEILDLSKIENGKYTFEEKPFSLKRMIVNLMEPFIVRAEAKNLTLTYSISPDVVDHVMGDLSHVSQVLMNLIHNAIKFTEKGAIDIQISPAPKNDSQHAEKGAIQRDQASPATFYLFSISDTGIGIPQDRIDTLFDAFTQADGSTTRRYGGSGLGTSVAKQLVVLMGGKIWVESTVGEGSTFYFTIPFKPAPDAINAFPPKTPLDSTGDASERQASSQRKILVVDDVPENVLLITKYLQREGFSVKNLQRAPDAIALLEKERFDLVLMDIHMPGMDGLEATRIIREQETGKGSHMPIVAVTASVMRDEIARYFEAGMDGVVQKPINFKELKKAVTTLLSPYISGNSPYFDESDAMVNQHGRSPVISDHGNNVSISTVKTPESTCRAALHDGLSPQMGQKDLQRVKDLLTQMKTACERYSPDAVAPFVTTLEKMIDRASLEPIQQKIDQFDFDGVMEEADRLIEKLSNQGME